MSSDLAEDQQRDAPKKLRINPVVFGVSAGVIVLFVIFGMIFGDPDVDAPESFGEDPAQYTMELVRDAIIDFGGWWLALAVVFFLVFVLFCGFSRFGRIRLGQDHERPEFGNWAWFTMLFSAGMGIGLVFFAVAEPIFYMSDTEFFPLPTHDPATLGALEALNEGTAVGDLDPGERSLAREAARNAMVYTFFHWGLHAWAIYIVMGMALAYMAFRRGKPLTVRYALHPLLGDRVEGRLGDLIDILAVFGTMFGIATSLGLGVSQINAGLAELGVFEVGTWQAVLLIAIITAIAIASVVSGLDKGIKNLSIANIVMAGLLMLFVLVTAPNSLRLLNAVVENTGQYLQNVIAVSFDTDALGDGEFQGAWTLFYWAWWISWSPFVGMFIARISRGRTIREFVLGVMFVPTAVTFVWLTVFGTTAIDFHLSGVTTIAERAGVDEAQASFALLQQLPLAGLTMGLLVVIVTLFFVTSSDSGSLVIDLLTADGSLDPPKPQRVFWATAEGAVAAVLLVAGGLGALQAASISTGLPFSVVLVAIALSLLRAFRTDPMAGQPRLRRRPGHPVAAAESQSGGAGGAGAPGAPGVSSGASGPRSMDDT